MKTLKNILERIEKALRRLIIKNQNQSEDLYALEKFWTDYRDQINSIKYRTLKFI